MSRPRAVLLVRNPFVHDARVLRSAAVLRDLGYDPLVVAVTSTRVRRRADNCRGVPVIRLDPQSPLSGVRQRLRGSSRTTGVKADDPASERLRRSRLGALVVRAHRWLRTLDFYRRAFHIVRAERPSLLHCNDYNTMWVGVLSRAFLGTRVLYDSHELWPDRNGRPEPRGWLLACEAFFVRAANRVITASPGYSAVMSTRYRVEAPTVVLNIPPAAPPTAAPAREPHLAVYVGGLMPHRGLEVAIDALVHAPSLRLRLIGPGREDYVAFLREHARIRGVQERVELPGPVSPDEVLETISGAAFGLALFEPVCLSHRLVAPNKLFEYLTAALPTLASDLPVMRDFLMQWRVGMTVSTKDARDVAARSLEMLDAGTNLRLRHAAAEAARVVTWERERAVLAQVYRQVTA